MKASELRIGNLVQDKQGNVKTISGDSLAEIDGFDDRLLIEPIPLTEELLLNFGFINGVFPDIEYFSVEGLNSMPESYGLYYENDWTAVSIEYVHQLQNLYFALTGKELDYDQN